MSIAYCISKRLSQNEKIAYIVFICYFYFFFFFLTPTSTSLLCLCFASSTTWAWMRHGLVVVFHLLIYMFYTRLCTFRVECLNVDFLPLFFLSSSRIFKILRTEKCVVGTFKVDKSQCCWNETWFADRSLLRAFKRRRKKAYNVNSVALNGFEGIFSLLSVDV